MHVIRSRLVLILLLIGWGIDVRFYEPMTERSETKPMQCRVTTSETALLWWQCSTHTLFPSIFPALHVWLPRQGTLFPKVSFSLTFSFVILPFFFCQVLLWRETRMAVVVLSSQFWGEVLLDWTDGLGSGIILLLSMMKAWLDSPDTEPGAVLNSWPLQARVPLPLHSPALLPPLSPLPLPPPPPPPQKKNMLTLCFKEKISN